MRKLGKAFSILLIGFQCAWHTTASQAQSCPDLPGTYDFHGEWLSITPEHVSAQLRKERQPMIVTDAFQVDLIDAEQILPGAQGLNQVVRPVCSAGQWILQSSVRGGGDFRSKQSR